MKKLYEINLQEFKEQIYDGGDYLMLDYLYDYITDDLKELYVEVMNYNEIYANGWNIQELFEMGKSDPYWTERAKNFIKKYNIPKKDYTEDKIDDYFELRDELLCELGLYEYLVSEKTPNDVPINGFCEEEFITSPKDFRKGNSYTVARVKDYGHCLELHYSNGKATLEYGYKISHNLWEKEIKDADWFKGNMTQEEIINKLWELFDNYFENANAKDNDCLWIV